MPNIHQQKHLDAMKLDAEEIQNPTDKAERLAEIADAETTWPDEFLRPSEIHDWIEKPDQAVTREILDERKVESLG